MAHNNTENVQKEYESSVSLPITADLYNSILTKKKVIQIITITYLHTGERSVCQMDTLRFERKTILKRQSICKIFLYKDRSIFLPLNRKVSNEVLVAAPVQIDVTSIVDRKIISLDGLQRISLESQATHIGQQYYLTAEVEYEASTLDNYSVLYHDFEKKLFQDLIQILDDDWIDLLDDTEVVCQKIPLTHLLGIGSRKFGTIGEAGRINGFKHKFDGYKGKVVFNNTTASLYTDMNLCAIIQTRHLQIKFPQNIIFQVELMNRHTNNKYPSIIFTDVLGFKRQDRLYVAEPVEVTRYFAFLNSCYKINVNMHTIKIQNTIYRIKTQYSVPKYEECLDEATDGMILISDNREIKFKHPTIDAVLSGEIITKNETKYSFDVEGYSLFVPQEEITSLMTNLKSAHQQHVFELALHEHVHDKKYIRPINEGSFNINAFLSQANELLVFTIVRRRNDRYTTSTKAELGTFLREIAEFEQMRN